MSLQKKADEILDEALMVACAANAVLNRDTFVVDLILARKPALLRVHLKRYEGIEKMPQANRKQFQPHILERVVAAKTVLKLYPIMS